jgi:predicted RecA/RadA family phage recombinase
MPRSYFVHDGQSIDHVPAADLAAGDIVVQGELVGMAKTAIAAGKLGALAVEGVFDFPVEELTGWTVGALAYWDGADFATRSASGTKLLGKVVLVDSRPGTPFVRVRVNQ